MNQEEIMSALPQFTCTENWYKFSPLSPNLMTDGAKFVADNCGAYWLMDAIASYQHSRSVSKENFQVWTLKKKEDGTWTLSMHDGNNNHIIKQKIPYSDFPLDEITIWAERNDLFGVTLLLPSEH